MYSVFILIKSASGFEPILLEIETMKCFTLQIKQVIGIVPFCITILSPVCVNALTVEEVPNPRQVNGTWVTDMANILSEDTENKINHMISFPDLRRECFVS